jgi:phage-related minor tail protein
MTKDRLQRKVKKQEQEIDRLQKKIEKQGQEIDRLETVIAQTISACLDVAIIKGHISDRVARHGFSYMANLLFERLLKNV